ncbi:MAG: hypothetical protein ACK5EA_16040, partial [Planctomycetaceae bacterium]
MMQAIMMASSGLQQARNVPKNRELLEASVEAVGQRVAASETPADSLILGQLRNNLGQVLYFCGEQYQARQLIEQ